MCPCAHTRTVSHSLAGTGLLQSSCSTLLMIYLCSAASLSLTVVVIITTILNGSVLKHKVHKVELNRFVSTDKKLWTCKQNKTWHRHDQVQSPVQLRSTRGGGHFVHRPQWRIKTFPSNADLPVTGAGWEDKPTSCSLNSTSHLACE